MRSAYTGRPASLRSSCAYALCASFVWRLGNKVRNGNSSPSRGAIRSTYISLAWAACGAWSLGSLSSPVNSSWRTLPVLIAVLAPIAPPTGQSVIRVSTRPQFSHEVKGKTHLARPRRPKSCRARPHSRRQPWPSPPTGHRERSDVCLSVGTGRTPLSRLV
jgi:hypothetical protein